MAEKKPTFYMMVGIPGVGKTTYARKIPNARVFSSDAIREELGVDGGDKEAHKKVFALLHQRIADQLTNDTAHDVVYDATNISSGKRVNYLKSIKNIVGRKVCIFFDIPLKVALNQNVDRDNPVPNAVIRKMSCAMDEPRIYEGWDEIRIVRELPMRNIDKIRNMSAQEYAEYMYSDYGLLRMNRDLGTFLSKEQFMNHFVQWLNSPSEDSNDVL